MQSNFIECDPLSLRDNPFKLIGRDWMLVTAGTTKSFNTMTASWGGLGVLWDKNVCFVFVRNSRYTWEFMEKHDSFSCSFFPDTFRRVLEYCGSHSGRHVNKISKCGITPTAGSMDDVYFKEARLVLECRKLYYTDISPTTFLAPTLVDIYAERDYHRMYVGEIVKTLARDATVVM